MACTGGLKNRGRSNNKVVGSKKPCARRETYIPPMPFKPSFSKAMLEATRNVVRLEGGMFRMAPLPRLPGPIAILLQVQAHVCRDLFLVSSWRSQLGEEDGQQQQHGNHRQHCLEPSFNEDLRLHHHAFDAIRRMAKPPSVGLHLAI